MDSTIFKVEVTDYWRSREFKGLFKQGAQTEISQIFEYSHLTLIFILFMKMNYCKYNLLFIFVERLQLENQIIISNYRCRVLIKSFVTSTYLDSRRDQKLFIFNIMQSNPKHIPAPVGFDKTCKLSLLSKTQKIVNQPFHRNL